MQRTRSSCSAWPCDVCDKQVPINVHPVINNWFGIPNGYIKNLCVSFYPIFLLSLLVFFGKLKIEFVAPFPQRTVEVRRHFNIKGRRKGKSEREIAGCAENLSWSVSGTGSGVKFC